MLGFSWFEIVGHRVFRDGGTLKQDLFNGLGVKQEHPLSLNVRQAPGFGFSAKPPHRHSKTPGHRTGRQQLGLR